MGLGIAAQAELLHRMPKLVQNLSGSAITAAACTAILPDLPPRVRPEPSIVAHAHQA